MYTRERIWDAYRRMICVLTALARTMMFYAIGAHRRRMALKSHGVSIHFEGMGTTKRKGPGRARGKGTSVTARRTAVKSSGRNPWIAFVDGCVWQNREGVGVWYQHGHRMNFAARLAGLRKSGSTAAVLDNNHAELVAVYVALSRHPRTHPLTVHTDSLFVLRQLHSLLQDLPAAQKGASRDGTRRILRTIEWMLYMRSAPTAFRKVPAHSGYSGNEAADALAASGSRSSRVLVVPDDAGVAWRAESQQWFDFVCSSTSQDMEMARMQRLEPLSSDVSVTQILALDCEMVGVGAGGVRSALARVCVCNSSGNVLLDSFVAVEERITDYRTPFSGIRPENLEHAPPFLEVQGLVRDLVRGHTVVGHALYNDFDVLGFIHPAHDVRDTANYPLLRNAGGRPRKLRHLAKEILGAVIQTGEHNPAEDARAALYIYHQFALDWEGSLIRRREDGEQEQKET